MSSRCLWYCLRQVRYPYAGLAKEIEHVNNSGGAMRTGSGIFLVLAYIALGVTLSLLLEGPTGVDSRYLGLIAGALISVLYFGHVSALRRLRMKRMYRDLKIQHPVVYGCGLHGNLRARCITSDQDSITIWDYRKKGEYEVIVRMKRAATRLHRELVQASLLMKYEGLVLENNQPETPGYIIVYWGFSGAALFPLKGAALDQALRQLSEGVVGEGSSLT